MRLAPLQALAQKKQNGKNRNNKQTRKLSAQAQAVSFGVPPLSHLSHPPTHPSYPSWSRRIAEAPVWGLLAVGCNTLGRGRGMRRGRGVTGSVGVRAFIRSGAGAGAGALGGGACQSSAEGPLGGAGELRGEEGEVASAVLSRDRLSFPGALAAGTRGPRAPLGVVFCLGARLHATLLVHHPRGWCSGRVVGSFAPGTQPMGRAGEYLGVALCVVWRSRAFAPPPPLPLVLCGAPCSNVFGCAVCVVRCCSGLPCLRRAIWCVVMCCAVSCGAVRCPDAPCCLVRHCAMLRCAVRVVCPPRPPPSACCPWCCVVSRVLLCCAVLGCYALCVVLCHGWLACLPLVVRRSAAPHGAVLLVLFCVAACCFVLCCFFRCGAVPWCAALFGVVLCRVALCCLRSVLLLRASPPPPGCYAWSGAVPCVLSCGSVIYCALCVVLWCVVLAC